MIKPLANFAKTRWERIRASYWFIPVCMMLIAFFLGYACIQYLPALVTETSYRAFIPTVPADTASDIISTVASAIITATSIAFSMTLVALTMASSQFGPRLLRAFMDDRGTQLVLGTLSSTFVFCLTALHQISIADVDILISSMLSLITLAIGILDTLVLIYFIHHIANFIQVDEIINHCYNQCTQNLSKLFALTDEQENNKTILATKIDPGAVTTLLSRSEAGYIQTIDYPSLLAQKGTTGVQIHVRAGDYIVPGETVITVHSDDTITKEIESYYLSCVVTGKSRTALQDPEFPVSQLVEIALRALSPGINDPITAMTCIDRLAAVCILMAKQRFPSDTIVNNENNVWLKRRTYTFESVINTAFDQIRQAGAPHVGVMLHLLGRFKTLKNELPQAHHGILDVQIQAIADLVKTSAHCEKDKADVAAAVSAASVSPVYT